MWQASRNTNSLVRSRTKRRPSRRSRSQHRRGASQIGELFVTFPVLLTVLYGIVQFSSLFSAQQALKFASAQGAQAMATTPPGMPAHLDEGIVQTAVEGTLPDSLKVDAGNGDFDFIGTIQCHDPLVSGGICTVTLEMDKADAAPDLLGMFGFSLTGQIQASTSMIKE
jgi:hypothetical protein